MNEFTKRKSVIERLRDKMSTNPYNVIKDFHDVCCGVDNMFNLNLYGFKRRFSKENVLNAYEKDFTYNSKIHVNGLFLATLSGNFKLAKYLIENKYFDPNEYFCGEVHILHLLATMCGRHTNSKKPIKPVFKAFEVFYENSMFINTSIIFETENEEIRNGYAYDVDEVVAFASELIDKYEMNVSVPIKWRWWDNTENEKSQASCWFNLYYKNVVTLMGKVKTYGFVTTCLSTPLVFASLFGSQKFVRLLVMNGCDLLCMNCKTVCKQCPINVLRLLYSSIEEDLDLFIDDEYRITYSQEEMDNYEPSSSQITANTNYMFYKVFDYLIEERCFLKKYTLQYEIVSKMARSILCGKYIKDFALLPGSLKDTIHIFIDTYYICEKYMLENATDKKIILSNKGYLFSKKRSR